MTAQHAFGSTEGPSTSPSVRRPASGDEAFDKLNDQLYGPRESSERREVFADLNGSVRLAAVKRAYMK